MAIDHSQAPSNISTEQAALQIDSLLADDPAYANDQPEERPSRRESQLRQAEEPEEAEEAEEEVSASDSEEQPEEESGEEEVESIDYDTLIEVKSKDKDGSEKSENIPLKDLISQRMLQSDYTRKTQELAQERAKVQSEITQKIETERQKFIDALDTQHQLMTQLLAPEASNMDQLAETDPAEFVRVQNRLSKIGAAMQEIESAKQKSIEEHRQYINTNVLPVEMEKLKEKVPNLDEVKPAIMQLGKDIGFTDQELGSIIDHRAIHTLNRLRVAESRVAELEKMIDQKKVVATKKVVEKPKVMKSQGNQPKRKGSESFNRLKKGGKMEDAANFFLDTIPDL